jgi:peptidoglycan glycosyltransferase
VNKQITRLAVTGVGLIVAVIVATTYWQTWAVAGLNDRQDNAIRRVAEFAIDRGEIRGRFGKRIYAANVKRRVGGKTLYLRRYPQRGLAAHTHGYSTVGRARSGLEKSFNDYLTGSNANLGTVVDTTLDRLRGTTVHGNDLHVTIDPGAQRVALAQLGTRCGAIVAFEPSTGRVLVMASSPSYDPNLVERRGGWAQIRRTRAQCSPADALVNRATQGRYAPGSTFKVVTAAAALASGKFSASSTFSDPGYCIEYGRRVYNYDTSSGFGTVNFVQAMQYSINSVFCNVGKQLGAPRIMETAARFGFYSRPPLETPAEERLPSGLYTRSGRPILPEAARTADPGRLAFGQERLLVTPMQMAMVAAAIANDGVVMRPYVVERIVSPRGGTIRRTKPDRLGRAIDKEHADVIENMMELVVSGGTGTAAQISGMRVAGKTGTAETGRAGINTTGFIGFAPADRPRVAVAVYVESQRGTGGVVAAPMARAVMQAILGAGRSG